MFLNYTYLSQEYKLTKTICSLIQLLKTNIDMKSTSNCHIMFGKVFWVVVNYIYNHPTLNHVIFKKFL
jgi:hypothetical protein